MPRRARRPHYWQKNEGTYVPRNLCFVQVKTMKAKQSADGLQTLERLDFGVADCVRWDEGRMKRWQRLPFTSSAEFWAWFHSRQRPKTSWWMIGHGIAGAFTLLEGWNLMRSVNGAPPYYTLMPPKHKEDKGTSFMEESALLVDADPPTIILLHHGNITLHVVDVQNYVKATVEEMAAELGRTIAGKPAANAPYKQWEKWLTDQTKTVRDFTTSLLEFWETNDCGNWRHTFAGLSMSAYRHKFLKEKVYVHTIPDVLEHEREALRGGEFVNYVIGPIDDLFSAAKRKPARRKKDRRDVRYGPVHTFDANSLYPAMMRQHKYPHHYQAHIAQASMEDLRVWRGQLCLMARVRLVTKEEPYPVTTKAGRAWAVGDFWTTLCGPELDRAYTSGHIQGIKLLAAYWPADMFSEFVDYFYGLRLQSPEGKGKLWDCFVKNLLVALPGKCGQRVGEWEFIPFGTPPKEWGGFPGVNTRTGKITNYRAIASAVQEQMPLQEGNDSIPIVAAFVNAYARDFMRTVRLAIGAEHLFYMGNDTLHVDDAGAERIKPWLESYPGELGKFRHTGTFDTAEYRGPSDYTQGDEHVIAGRMADASDIVDAEYWQDVQQGLRSIITHEPSGFLRVQRVKVGLNGYHASGIVNPDGSVSPPQCFAGELHYDRDFPQAIPWQPAHMRTGPYAR